MAKVIQIGPADIAHDGRPRFGKGIPDERNDVITMKVAHKLEYQAAQPGDTLQYEGQCFEVVSSSAMIDAPDSEGQIGGVIVFSVYHKGVIPC